MINSDMKPQASNFMQEVPKNVALPKAKHYVNIQRPTINSRRFTTTTLSLVTIQNSNARINFHQVNNNEQIFWTYDEKNRYTFQELAEKLKKI